MSIRVGRFYNAHQSFMGEELLASFEKSPEQYDTKDLGRLARRLKNLRGIGTVLPPLQEISLGDVSPEKACPDFEIESQYYAYFVARNLGLSFAYEKESGHLLLGTKEEVEELVEVKKLYSYTRPELSDTPPVAKKTETPVEEVTAGKSTSWVGGAALAWFRAEQSVAKSTRKLATPFAKGREKKAFVPRQDKETRIRQLVIDGELDAASSLLFGNTPSYEEVEATVLRQGLRYSLGDLLEAGNAQHVVDFVAQAGRARGAAAVLRIIRGRQVDDGPLMGGFSDPRKAAVVLFKLSFRNRALVDQVFQMAREHPDRGVLTEALNYLNENYPRIFRSWPEFRDQETKTVFKEKNGQLAELEGPTATLEPVFDRSFAPVLLKVEGKEVAAPTTAIRQGFAGRGWDALGQNSWALEYGLVDKKANDIGTLQRYATLEDFHTACHFLFAEERAVGEIAALLNTSYLRPAQIFGILQALGRENLKLLLCEVAAYGQEARKARYYYDGFFDGVLIALAEQKTESLADLFEEMIHSEETAGGRQRQAAYYLLSDGVNPIMETICSRYNDVLWTLCGRREEYASPHDFLFEGRLLPEDSQPAKRKPQVKFYHKLLLADSSSDTERLQSIVRLVQLGQAAVVKRYLERTPERRESYIGWIVATAEVAHPFLNANNLDILFSLIDYECSVGALYTVVVSFQETTSQSLQAYLSFLEYLYHSRALIGSDNRGEQVEGWRMLLSLRTRRVAKLAAPAAEHEEGAIRAIYALNFLQDAADRKKQTKKYLADESDAVKAAAYKLSGKVRAAGKLVNQSRDAMAVEIAAEFLLSVEQAKRIKMRGERAKYFTPELARKVIAAKVEADRQNSIWNKKLISDVGSSTAEAMEIEAEAFWALCSSLADVDPEKLNTEAQSSYLDIAVRIAIWAELGDVDSLRQFLAGGSGNNRWAPIMVGFALAYSYQKQGQDARLYNLLAGTWPQGFEQCNQQPVRQAVAHSLMTVYQEQQNLEAAVNLYDQIRRNEHRLDVNMRGYTLAVAQALANQIFATLPEAQIEAFLSEHALSDKSWHWQRAKDGLVETLLFSRLGDRFKLKQRLNSLIKEGRGFREQSARRSRAIEEQYQARRRAEEHYQSNLFPGALGVLEDTLREINYRFQDYPREPAPLSATWQLEVAQGWIGLITALKNKSDWQSLWHLSLAKLPDYAGEAPTTSSFNGYSNSDLPKEISDEALLLARESLYEVGQSLSSALDR
ncbi:MAG: hypothetical protein ABH823_01225 [bacterium]